MDEISLHDLTEWDKAGLVVIEAIHPTMTKNYNVYTEGALLAAYETFTAPYNKPQIVNHDMGTEIEGRVAKVAWGLSLLKPGSKAIFVGISIPEQATRDKWKSGLYKTTSVGASVSSVICSVCEKDQIKDGWCGHQKGRAYEGRVAKWIVNSLREFDEISRVNAPADEYSQSINHLLAETAGTAGEGSEHRMEDTLREMEELLSDLDQVTENNDEITAEGNPPANEDATTQEADQTLPGAAEQSNSVQEELDRANARITVLEAELAEATAKVQVAETVQLELVSAKEQLQVAEAESALALKKTAELARALHRQLAERVVDLQLLTAQASGERSALIGSLVKEKATALYAQLKDLEPARAIRVATRPVTNPAVVTGARDGELVVEGSGSGKKSYTLAEAEQLLGKTLNWSSH